MHPITEQDLMAYVDGQLDPDQRAAVEAYLAAHPQDAARVNAYRKQIDTLHALYDPALDEPLPTRLQKPASRTFSSMRYAAMLGWLAVGLTVGWVARGPAVETPTPLTSLPQQAMLAHAVYSSEVQHPVEVSGDQEAHLAKWLSKRLGNEIKPPNLSNAGLHLMGGRLLPDATGPAAQFMYQDAQGQRLTLYVRNHAPGARETAFRYEKNDGVSVFYWVDGPFGYALSGELDRAILLEVSKLVYQQLSS